MLHNLKPTPGSTKKRKRLARGDSAGGGSTAGKGTKGQDARSGKGKRVRGFEGGQTPLIRRQPKLGGFKRDRKVDYEIVNLDKIEARLDAGTYDLQGLKEAKIVRSSRPVKILAGTSLTKKFVLTANAASAGAKSAVEKAGGSLTIVNPSK